MLLQTFIREILVWFGDLTLSRGPGARLRSFKELLTLDAPGGKLSAPGTAGPACAAGCPGQQNKVVLGRGAAGSLVLWGLMWRDWG